MSFMDTVGGMVSGFDVIGGVLTFGKWFFFPLLIGLGMYGLWWLFSFNVRVKIFVPGKPSIIDKGKRVRNKDNSKIKGFSLLKFKKDYSGASIDERFFSSYKKSFGRVGEELHLLRDDKGNLQPIMPPSNDSIVEWEGLDSSDVAWGMEEAKSGILAYATKNDAWSKLSAIAPYLGLAFVVVLMIVLLQQMGDVVTGLQSVANALNNINVAEQVVS